MPSWNWRHCFLRWPEVPRRYGARVADTPGTALTTDDAVARSFTPLSDGAARALVGEHYKFVVTGLRRFPSERDDTVQVTTAQDRYVLKVASPHEDPAVIDMQTRAAVHAAAVDPTLPLARLIPARDGALTVAVPTPEGVRTARLMTYLPGRTLDYANTDAAQRRRCGQVTAQLSLALKDFEHPAADRRMSWDLQRFGSLRPLLPYLQTGPARAQVSEVLDAFDARVAPVLPGLPAQVLHNDVNPGNVLVDPAVPGFVTGILDFGETVRTAVVTEVAIAMAYAAYDEHDPWAAPGDVLEGFQDVRHLSADELALIPDLVRARQAQRLLLISYMSTRVPSRAERNSRHLASTVEALGRVLRRPPPDWIRKGRTQ